MNEKLHDNERKDRRMKDNAGCGRGRIAKEREQE